MLGQLVLKNCFFKVHDYFTCMLHTYMHAAYCMYLIVVGHFVIFIPLHLAFTNWFCCISCKPLASLLLCLSETNMSQRKVDGWKTSFFPFGSWVIFRTELEFVSGRVSRCIKLTLATWQLSKQNGSDFSEEQNESIPAILLAWRFLLSAETTARVLWQQLL